jgi:hypothetical protein
LDGMMLAQYNLHLASNAAHVGACITGAGFGV